MIPDFGKLAGSKCSRFGCLSVAGWVPLLRLWAPFAPETAFAEMTFAIPLCGNCTMEVKLEDLLNEKDWFLVEEGFLRNNAPLPDRKRTKIYWLPITKTIIPASALPIH